MNLFPPHFKSFYWIFSCVCYKVFVPTSFTFFWGKKIQWRVCHKKGEHMWTHKGIMQNIGGYYWQTNFHGNRKKSWVNIDYYLYNAHSDRSVCSTDQDIKYANVPIYYYYHGFLPPPPFSFSATCICNMIVSRENLNFFMGQNIANKIVARWR